MIIYIFILYMHSVGFFVVSLLILMNLDV